MDVIDRLREAGVENIGIPTDFHRDAAGAGERSRAVLKPRSGAGRWGPASGAAGAGRGAPATKMEAVVSDILRSRMQRAGRPDADGRALHRRACGGAGHAGVRSGHSAESAALRRRPSMTISLGGTPGPKTGGTDDDRRTNAFRPPRRPTAPKIDRVAMPTPKAEPAMVMPIPDPKTETEGAAEGHGYVEGSARPCRGPRGRDPERQHHRRNRRARAWASGFPAVVAVRTACSLDVQNFCCPEYLQDMVTRIRANWVEQQQASRHRR